MGALTIAFDTIIVGALALPWVYLIIHMFFFEGEIRFLHWFGIGGEKKNKKKNGPGQKQGEGQNQEENKEQTDGKNWTDNQVVVTVVSILLFAVTYTLGSSIERIAQDFFNDDDLNFPGVFRMPLTENRIIAHVYCGSDEQLVSPSSITSPALKKRLSAFLDTYRPPPPRLNPACGEILSASGRHASLKTNPTPEYAAAEKDLKDLKDLTWDIFGIEENGVLLKGEEDTLRLRQMHDQIVVLRGATFNGLVAFSLCLFAAGVKARRKNYRGRGILACAPAVFLVFAGLALYHHIFVDREIDPPYMEFSLLSIGGVGVFMLWLKPLFFNSENSLPEKTPAEKMQTAETQARDSQAGGPNNANKDEDCFLRWKWGRLSFIFAFLFVAGVLGWWATEVLYVQEVIYSYDSQVTAETKTVSNSAVVTAPSPP
jgi:hypothetical protein